MPTPFKVGPVFAYLVAEDPITLVDAGVGYPDGREALRQGLTQAGLAPTDIRRVLITHCHSDHVGNSGWIQELSGAEVWIHPDEGAKLQNPDWHREARQHQLTLAGMPEVERQRAERFIERGRQLITVPTWKPLQDGQRFSFANGAELEALLLPGHALGHTGFLVGETLLGGDHLLIGVTPNPIMEPVPEGHIVSLPHAPGRAGTLGQFRDSLERVKRLEVARVLPGHGPVIADHRRVVEGYLATHERRLTMVEKHLGNGITPWELAAQLYPRVRDFDVFLALTEVLAHLDQLVVLGRAVLENGRFRGR